MKIAIIGSGLAGMTAARELHPHHDVTVFEKSRGSSGRMCTRRRTDDHGTEFAFDHGAQYFTIRSEAFRDALVPFIEDGTVQPWDVPMVTIAKDGSTTPRAHQAFVACPGMTALAKAIGRDVSVLHEVEIAQFNQRGSLWTLTDKNGEEYNGFDLVVSAIPAKQAEALMPDMAAREGLDQVKMMACFTVMLGYHGPLEFSWGGAFVEDHALGFIAVNSTKPGRHSAGSRGGASIVVQANNEWAEPRIEEDPQVIEQQMHHAIMDLIGLDTTEADLTSFHRWRYAATKTPLGKSHIFDRESGRAIIGDWCLKGRVEAAFESGLALAQDIMKSS